MSIEEKYLPSNRLSDLISDNFMLLMVMSRFEISLGFGEKSVQEVCNLHNVDCKTFLAVANFISSNQTSYSTDDLPEFSLESLMIYLKNAHSYFLDFSLPRMRRELLEAIDCSSGDNKVAFLIIQFFDQLVKEVENHMEEENHTIFGYVKKLLNGQKTEKYSISK